MTDCPHDYDTPIRRGRCSYECRLCGADISMQVILIGVMELDENERKVAKKPIELKPEVW